MTRKNKLTKNMRRIKGKVGTPFLVKILICHGKDQEIVEDLINLGKSIGLSTSNVINLPSKGLNQNDRVDYAITNSKLIIVLASFNEDEPDSLNARPNVYDELRLAYEKKTRDTIVLQEVDNNEQEVKLPTNLIGHCVIIQFKRRELHKMYPCLLAEIRSRMSIDYENDLSQKLKSGGVLNKFLDQMDRIWENEFDRASDKIGKDWETENKFQTLLDEFFQQYWAVFDALVRKKVDNEQLILICDKCINSSNNLALNAWKAVAEGKYKRVEELIKETPKKALSEIKKKMDKAFELIRKKRDNHRDKIQDYFDAINELQDTVDKF